MHPKLVFILPVIFFSCNSRQVKTKPVDLGPTNDSATTRTVTAAEPPMAIPADTASFEYLMYLIKSEKSLNDHWIKKLETFDGFFLMNDTMSRLSIDRSWVINDSISVTILSHATGVSLDEYLITVKNKKDIISNVHIKDAADADVTENNRDYEYMEYQQVDDRKIKLFKHLILNYDTDKEKDSILAIENWTIRDNGMAVKK